MLLQELPSDADKFFGKHPRIVKVICQTCTAEHDVKYEFRRVGVGRNSRGISLLSTGMVDLATHMELRPGDWIAFARPGPPYHFEPIGLSRYHKNPRVENLLPEPSSVTGPGQSSPTYSSITQV